MSQRSRISCWSVLVVFTAVCVAGHTLSKSEILELHLPLRLFAEENKVRRTSRLWGSVFKMSQTEPLLCVGVFRVSVQSGTSKLSMVVSQMVPSAASDTSQERGELPGLNPWFSLSLRSRPWKVQSLKASFMVFNYSEIKINWVIAGTKTWNMGEQNKMKSTKL